MQENIHNSGPGQHSEAYEQGRRTPATVCLQTHGPCADSGIFHRGGPMVLLQRGSNIFQGGGVQMLISLETHIT